MQMSSESVLTPAAQKKRVTDHLGGRETFLKAARTEAQDVLTDA